MNHVKTTFFVCIKSNCVAISQDSGVRSRYNRRKRDLWSVMLAVRMSLQIVLDALLLEETAVIDSVPVPCVGYKRGKQASDFAGKANYGVCSSKAMKYFGFKLHTLVTLTGVVMGFVLAAANRYDNQPVVELLDSFSHHINSTLYIVSSVTNSPGKAIESGTGD